MRREVYRKLVHLATVGVPLLAWLLPRPAGLALLGGAVVAALAVEWARARVRWVRYHFLRRTRLMLRSHERRGIAGATYMAVAYFLALLLLPAPIAVAAMLYNGLGDASAALVGRRWGRHRTAWGKSWEGAGAALVVCLAVGLLVPGVPREAALLGALAAAAIEFLPLPLDDNLRVTLGGGAAAWAGAWLGGSADALSLSGLPY
jgi:dolichol kinase